MKLRALCVILATALAFPAAAASSPPRVISFIGDSTSSGLYAPPGYPALLSQLMKVRIHNLVVRYPPSYTIGQALSEEVPKVPKDTTDVIIWLGIDDLRGIRDGAETLEGVEKQHDAMIAALLARRLRVYELTIHDYIHEAAFNPQPGDDAPSSAKLPMIVETLNEYYKGTPGITVIDVHKWDDVFTGNWTRDGVHFTAERQAIFVEHLAAAITIP